jgi:hypothetical protein
MDAMGVPGGIAKTKTPELPVGVIDIEGLSRHAYDRCAIDAINIKADRIFEERMRAKFGTRNSGPPCAPIATTKI